MKRKIMALLALLLCAALLGGCAELSSLPDALQERLPGGEPDGEEMPHFDNIVYERPVLDTLRADLDAVEQALDEGKGLRTLEPLLDRCYEDYYHYMTMYNLAYIRSCQDLRDAYYAGEYAWCDENMALLSQLMEEMYLACGGSALAGELEEQYFWEGFAEEYGDQQDAQYDQELVALLREESVLLSHYRALMSNSGAPEESGEESLLFPPEDEDGGQEDFYLDYNEALGELYIELVTLRGRIAAKLGYDGYEAMAYEYDYQRDYSVEQAEDYLEQIRTWLVPLYREYGTDWGDAYAYDLFTPRLRRCLAEAAQGMGGDILEAYDFMDEYGLCDLEISLDKAETSFQVYLDDYEAPFLFLDAWGYLDDLLSAAHEFGHYVDAYVNYDAAETVDVSETFSQAMEYLMLGYLEDALPAEQWQALCRLKLLDTLDLYAQQGSFAEFEHRVYAMDPEELSVEALNALFLELTKAYGYYDGESEDYYAASWTSVSHFFESPFYIIAYPVSNDVAMQIYELEQREQGAGLEKYLELLPRQYSGLIDTVTAGGLKSPFAPGRIEQVARDLRTGLERVQQAA